MYVQRGLHTRRSRPGAISDIEPNLGHCRRIRRKVTAELQSALPMVRLAYSATRIASKMSRFRLAFRVIRNVGRLDR
jgi:hypothetical protein